MKTYISKNISKDENIFAESYDGIHYSVFTMNRCTLEISTIAALRK